MNKLASLSTIVFDGYGTANLVGIAYFNQWSDELSVFDYSQVVLYQMANFPQRYVLDFMLSTPFLWKTLGGSVWVKILKSAIRPDTTKSIDQVGNFADIEFLSRYVGVDALDFLYHMQEADEATRHALLVYFKKFAYELVPSSLDDEDLDGIYFVAQEDLKRLRRDLCQDYGFTPVSFTDDNVVSYVNGYH